MRERERERERVNRNDYFKNNMEHASTRAHAGWVYSRGEVIFSELLTANGSNVPRF